MNQSIEQYRAKLKILNAKYKKQIICDFELKKRSLLEELRKQYDKWKESNDIHRFMLIGKITSQLSFYNCKDVINNMKELGISQYTLRKFVDFNSIFRRLDLFQNQSNYLFPYKIVWPLYVMYSDFLIQDFLAIDYGIDISAIAKKINRQRHNLTFPFELKENEMHLKQLQRFFKDDFIFNLSEKNTISSMAHVYAYPHKSVYKAMYKEIEHFNCELLANELNVGDYKVDFYDLLVIILRNQGLLNKNEEVIDRSYYNERQHKILTVNSILGL
ncbi:hypothetical protein [Winogradskyella tangerina]|uniref:hypothetical protein n=1 Tax=Winogradskyella tangerina TaxID=2023240 RepID=UPI000DBE1A25|nr:hypothetical protein [Winogradskyella tangerina]